MSKAKEVLFSSFPQWLDRLIERVEVKFRVLTNTYWKQSVDLQGAVNAYNKFELRINSKVKQFADGVFAPVFA